MAQKCSLSEKRWNDKRGLIFLSYESHRFVNVNAKFAKLSMAERRYYEKSFDYWAEGEPTDHRFHGWKPSLKNGIYSFCFVFKNTKSQFSSRIYGFLHSDPKSAGHQLCVLTYYAKKKKWLTDESILDKMNELRSDRAVQKALEVLMAKHI